MTNSLELYQGVLYHLNRYNAPDFDLPDFRFYINEAVNDWLTEELKQFELTQVITDRLRVLIKESVLSYNASGATNVIDQDLPGDYRHLVRSEVKFFYKEATLVREAGSLRKVISKRLTGDNWAYIYDNYYLTPEVTDSDATVYSRAMGSKLRILFDSPNYPNTKINVRDASIEYIRKPVAITLPDDFTPAALEFPEDVNRIIAKICADNFIKSKLIQK